MTLMCFMLSLPELSKDLLHVGGETLEWKQPEVGKMGEISKV